MPPQSTVTPQPIVGYLKSGHEMGHGKAKGTGRTDPHWQHGQTLSCWGGLDTGRRASTTGVIRFRATDWAGRGVVEVER
jgi:hypothetical protein